MMKNPHTHDTSPEVTVQISLTNGHKVNGKLTEFRPSQEPINIEISFTNQQGKTKDMKIKLEPKKVAYVAFSTLEEIVPEMMSLQESETQESKSQQEFEIQVMPNEKLSVNVNPDDIKNSIGFFAVPLSRGTVYRALFIYSHAVKRLENKEPIGSLLMKQGLVDPESLERGLGRQATYQAPPIGEILVEQHVIDKDEVDKAAQKQAEMAKQGRPMRLGEILVEAGLATDEDIKRALDAQKTRKGKRLGEVLVDLGIVKEIDVAKTLAQKFQLPFVNLDDEAPDESAFEQIPKNLIEKYRVFPFKLTQSEIYIALSDPLAMEPLDMLRFSISKRIVEVMVMPSQLEHYIRTYITGDNDGMPDLNVDDIMAELDRSGQDVLKGDIRDKDFIEARADDSAIAKLVNRIIVEGYRRGASDIHVEPYGNTSHTVVRFRIDGVCSEFQKIPAANRKQVIARIKIMAALDITERRLPQDGKIRFRISNRTIELRVATIPTVNDNEDVVLRILASAGAMPLNKMNFSENNLKNLDRLVNRPYGMLLAVGPTGSGKTTTLHALVGHINDAKRKIWTAEDPVEITQYGLRQVQVKPAIGFTFASAMRAFLRADPDVILVGEMRDKETASIGVEASLTGHLVLSTLHTNSAVETVTRLIDMGLDPFSFADALLGVLAQRLARRLCPKCKEPYNATDEELEELSHFMSNEHLEERLQGKPLQLWQAKGCDKCNYKGFKGRLGIHELLVVSPKLREAIQHQATVDELVEMARKEGMQTLLEDGIDKAIAGLTDIKKVLAVCSR